MSGKPSRACDRITAECIECGACIDRCLLLQKIGEPIKEIAARRPSFEEAYSCSLCHLCEGTCPTGLYPGSMFAQARRETVEQGGFPTEDCAYLMTDRPVTMMGLYREKYGVSYSELALEGDADLAFLPGCTLMTYSPRLTRRAAELLKTAYPRLLLLEECCGLPLGQLGFPEREKGCGMRLLSRMKEHKVNTVVTACPNCYNVMRELARREKVELHVRTLYSVLEELPGFKPQPVSGCTVTLHDSCPDRAEGVFAAEVRRALASCGYTLKEMERNRGEAPCCGSGGQIAHFDPGLSEALVSGRISEAGRTGADILACYCMGCALNLNVGTGGQKVRHVLSLMFGLDEDCGEAKERAALLFQGPEGEENWTRLMQNERES